MSEWHYAGVTVTDNKTRRKKQVFWFTGRLDNRNRTPVTMSLTYKSNREVVLVCYKANPAIRYFGGWGEDEVEAIGSFLEHDLAA